MKSLSIAVIGTGNVGSTLARRWAALGHTIRLGARDPSSADLAAAARKMGPKVSVHSPQEAAESAEVILLAVPWSAAKDAVSSIGNLEGKILIDCTNPLKKDLSGLELGLNDSGGERVREWAKGARVFKAFNTVGYNIMDNPVLEGRKTLMFFCGDGDTGRDVVRELVTSLDFEAIDAGSLESARLLEPWALLWIQSAYLHGLGRDFGFSVVHRK